MATARSFRAATFFASRRNVQIIPTSRPIAPSAPTITRPCRIQFLPQCRTCASIRHESTAAVAAAPTDSSNPKRKPWRAAPHRRPDEPVYELYFTCKACNHRSGHSISKQGYHNGTVLVQCPGCSNRHLISDHLKIFYDRRVTLEDIMGEKGQSVSLGSLDMKGDVELWEKDAADRAEGMADEKRGKVEAANTKVER